MIHMENGVWAGEIALEKGGNIVQLTCGGEPVLRTPGQAGDNPYLFGMPVLLPANRTTHGRFTFEGRAYQLPVNEAKAPSHLHGLVHLQTFTLEEKGDAFMKVRYDASPEVYPFPFTIRILYTLTGRSLRTEYAIENTGEGRMPLVFAMHTTFVEPEWFRVPISLEQERDDHNLATGRYIPLSPDQAIYARGMDPRTQAISGYYLACGHEAVIGPYRYSASEEFDHWILFNGGGGKGLLCVEPQLGAVNGLNQPDGCRVLAPGEVLRLWTEITRE